MKGLDAYPFDNVDLIKMDIEGHGAEALKGASRTLSRTRFVIIETHGRKEVSQASDILHRAGFDLIDLRRRTLIYEKQTTVT